MRIDAEALGPGVFARVDADLASPAVPPDVVNALPKDQQRELIRAELKRKQLARAASRGG